MRSNGAEKQGTQRVTAGLASGQNKGGLKLVSDSNAEQDGLDWDVVLEMARKGLGQALDEVHQATHQAQRINHLRKLFKRGGDHAAEDALTQALRGLEAASKTN